MKKGILKKSRLQWSNGSNKQSGQIKFGSETCKK